ncbi:MAG TPA: Sec-independent protein translocase protein TatB, partial [Steroidobacteraceae bacterium]|nr:Sec-independent protein translocase protein TatB [Steroidobacteraceae bacterium]
MFSIDFPEIVIILGVALVVLGPKKLPVAAAKIGRWVGRARTMARQFREQLEQEVSSAENAADIRKTVDSVGTP